MIPLKIYLIRAVYDWCCDNHFTPHLVVYVNEYTQVPKAYVHDDEIVLNISFNAVKNLELADDFIRFMARFNGQSQEIIIPVGHVRFIFAQENHMGLPFEVEPYQPQSSTTSSDKASTHQDDEFNDFKIIKMDKK